LRRQWCNYDQLVEYLFVGEKTMEPWLIRSPNRFGLRQGRWTSPKYHRGRIDEPQSVARSVSLPVFQHIRMGTIQLSSRRKATREHPPSTLSVGGDDFDFSRDSSSSSVHRYSIILLSSRDIFSTTVSISEDQHTPVPCRRSYHFFDSQLEEI